MTEEEWLQTSDFEMGQILMQVPTRKQRLFVSACCRAIAGLEYWPLITWALDVSERYADGGWSGAELRHQQGRLRAVRNTPAEVGNQRLLRAMEIAIHEEGCWLALFDSNVVSTEPPLFSDEATRRIHYTLFCDITGPTREVALDPRWRSETAVALATGIYADRAFDRLPILADALEEAGCDHTDVLTHCRGPGPHARGCWVVDGVLGKV